MSSYRWVASLGVVIALAAATGHYSMAPAAGGDGPVAYLDHLGPVWPLFFGAGAVFLVAALLLGRARYAAHVVAAGCLSTYAVALWGTAILTVSTRGVVTAGLATALAVHALLLATVYSRGGAEWTRR